MVAVIKSKFPNADLIFEVNIGVPNIISVPKKAVREAIIIFVVSFSLRYRCAVKIVKIGTAAVIIAALIAWVILTPVKNRIRLMLVPNNVAITIFLMSDLSSFNCFSTNGKKIIVAAAERINAREKTGTWVNVSFIIGAVAPQMSDAAINIKNARLGF